MEKIIVCDVAIYYDPEYQEAVDEVALACEQSVQTITNLWQLNTPQDCRVYILSNWPRCVFLGAPFRQQIILGITFPLWYREFKKRWQYAGGWSQGYGERQVIGIKAPHLLTQTPDPIGSQIFINQNNIEDKVRSIVCHELTHAFTSHLNLPSWVNEGLAMVSVDRCLGGQTVHNDTLQLLGDEALSKNSVDKIDLNKQSQNEIILLYVRGYWLTRYLLETQPELIIKMLEEHCDHKELEHSIANVLSIRDREFWVEVDQLIVARYDHEST